MISRQVQRYEVRKAAKAFRLKGPSGQRPNRFFGQTEMDPVGFLQTRAHVRKHFHQLKAQMRRMARKIDYNWPLVGEKFDDKGNRIPFRVLHETKGWQSARIA